MPDQKRSFEVDFTEWYAIRWRDLNAPDDEQCEDSEGSLVWWLVPKQFFDDHGCIPDFHSNVEVPRMQEYGRHEFMMVAGVNEEYDDTDVERHLHNLGFQINDDPLWYFDKKFHSSLRMKYIIVRRSMDTKEYSIVFPDQLIHKEVAAIESLKYFEIVSAGHCTFHGTSCETFGFSESLGIKSRPEDTEIITRDFFGQTS